MNLANHSYYNIKQFLKLNLLKKIKQKPCVEHDFNNNKNNDIYELIIISNDEYFDCDETKGKTITYGDCYYYSVKFNDETFYNELSVLDCGGYYIAICIFKNKLNITNEVIYNKNNDKDEDFIKYHMNTFIGNKYEIIKINK